MEHVAQALITATLLVAKHMGLRWAKDVLDVTTAFYGIGSQEGKDLLTWLCGFEVEDERYANTYAGVSVYEIVGREGQDNPWKATFLKVILVNPEDHQGRPERLMIFEEYGEAPELIPSEHGQYTDAGLHFDEWWRKYILANGQRAQAKGIVEKIDLTSPEFDFGCNKCGAHMASTDAWCPKCRAMA